ncbi:4a-hydroxytetrahydrobiopterin dehydratase [Psychromonas hadalis]|uniref:4a-hydroxytetrahydrobiopterin dehydratase n=1 Tax=Psychromonas hadalis TaxID=211669 RepID=UPI0003B58511|nr:4a-hydroxytetrahydrobiopterin dehydratase [Psychromonas hadalis]
MQNLAQLNCKPCDKNTSVLTADEMAVLLTDLNGWQVIMEIGIHKLTQCFVTKNYKNSMAFTNAVAQLAESVNHHPLLIVEYGKVTVTWWSHNIEGLHKNDFIMAAKTSLLFSA